MKTNPHRCATLITTAELQTPMTINFLFSCSLASWTDDFLIATAIVASFTVHYTISATDRTRHGFAAVTCFTGHIIWFSFCCLLKACGEFQTFKPAIGFVAHPVHDCHCILAVNFCPALAAERGLSPIRSVWVIRTRCELRQLALRGKMFNAPPPPGPLPN